MIIVNILFFILAIILILYGKFSNKSILNKFYIKAENIINKNYNLIIFLLFLLIIFTSTYKLGEVPYGLHVDEAGMAYDALSLANFKVDRFLNKYPVYLINYGGGQSAMYAYLTAILIKIFGYSNIIIRIPSVIIRLLLSLCAFFIIKEEKSKTKNIIFLLLLAISPYFIMQSRWGLDCNLLVGFITISIFFFKKAINKNNNILLFLSGIMFGLSLYTYALSYLIIPLFLGIICLYLLYIKKLKFHQLIIFGIPLAILALPLILMLLVNNGIIDQINSFITIPKLVNYRGSELSFKNFFHNFYIILSTLTFDNPNEFGTMLTYNATRQFGTIFYFTIPFTLVGLFQCLKKCIKTFKNREFNNTIIFSILFISVLFCQLLIYQPNINKANAIFIAIIYFSTQGIYEAVKNKKNIVTFIFLCLVLNFILFSNYYFKRYNSDNMNQHLFATCYLDILEYSKNLKKEYVYIDNDITSQQYIYILLDNSISPYEYNEKVIKTTFDSNNITYIMGIPDDVNHNAVYVIKNDNTEFFNKFQKLDFKNNKICNITIFYN